MEETGMYLLDAIEKGYIIPTINKKVSKSDKEKYFKDWEVELIYPVYTSTQNNIKYEYDELIITLPSINQRFNVNNPNRENGRKVNM